MQLNRISMRHSLVATLVVMGGLVIAFVLGSSEIYRQLSIENEHAALAELTRLRVSEMRKDLETDAVRHAVYLQSRSQIQTALAKKDGQRVRLYLDGLFQDHRAGENGHKPIGVYVFDSRMNMVAAVPQTDALHPVCHQLPLLAVRRSRATQKKNFSGLCVVDHRLYHATIVALGDREPVGYLQVTVDMQPKLIAMEKTSGLPLKLTDSGGNLLYQSVHWPATEHGLTSEYTLSAHTGTKNYLHLAFYKDIAAFDAELAHTRYFVLLAAVAATAIVALIALLMLQITTINPLQKLTTVLRQVREDERYLGQQVEIGGNIELAELASGFNEMTTKLKQLYQDLEHMAFTDSLTKLPNRVLLLDRLQQMILASQREHKPFALFIMDLDNFKDINDTLGHPMGDQLLQQVAERLSGKLRKSDTIARLGGDEFAILLPRVDAKYAATAARMLLQSLRTPFVQDGHSFDIGASIGIALYPDHGVDASVLLQRADVAMYAAKRAKGGHAFYDNELDKNYPNRLQRLGELRHAIDQEQFVLYYQPKVNLHNDQLCGVEALVRWQHPDGRLLLPDEFIPLLEQNGLIKNLTVWVLNEALQKSKALRARGQALPISINLSVRDLQDQHLMETITEVLAANQAEPESLELEITESAVMTDPDHALEVLTRLSGMGMKLTVDDFGTGYSSLAYLKKLPVKSVKIDKSFIMGMAEDDSDAAIVRTSIELAHNLGLYVVAEGVNSGEILERLKLQHCDAAQGTYISRALSNEELDQWILKSAWSLSRQRDGLPQPGEVIG